MTSASLHREHSYASSSVGHRPSRGSLSSRHSHKGPSLIEKLCFGTSTDHTEHDDLAHHHHHHDRPPRRRGGYDDDQVYEYPVHHPPTATYPPYNSMSSMSSGLRASEAHPSWSSLHPSMQTYYEHAPMPQIGILQAPSLGLWSRPSAVSMGLRAPSLPQLPSLGQLHQSMPSRPTSPPRSPLVSPSGSVAIPVPPPLAGVSVPGATQEPVAVAGIDTTHDGHANLYVAGVDRNRNGIPDMLEAPVAFGPLAAASLEHRRHLFQENLQHQLETEGRRIQEKTSAQKEIVRQRALEQKANIDRQALAAMSNLDRREVEQVVGLQRSAYNHHSQLELQAAQAQAAHQLQHFGRNGIDMRTHSLAAPQMQFPQMPSPHLQHYPPQVLPVATAGIDTNFDGRPNFVVTGPDMNRDGIPDMLQMGWHAGAHPVRPQPHVFPPGYGAPPFINSLEVPSSQRRASATSPSRSPRSPVVVEFPSQNGLPPLGSPVNASVLGNTVQVEEEDDAIDENGLKRKVFQISGLNGEPLAIVQMLQ